ncbi:hypothetical protein ebA3343 [Aromatoleum aromaticum EbN1]|uniref:Uncharacterized protein n=1 Tax=Aromatoleum aromaticum (strain DSM 19018 / LMG 30748 / EbN1) TaxID=76114 RepID=Q5P3V3_AROAE|nr:hypothetical protein ebA3343 [Aromatoleum aromaticum EbN1]
MGLSTPSKSREKQLRRTRRAAAATHLSLTTKE